MALTYADQLLRETAHAAFWQSYVQLPTLRDGIVYETTSNADQEIYPWLAYAPGVREMTGSRQKRSVPQLTYTIVNKKWENTIVIDYALRKYGKLGQVAATLGQLGEKARQYPDKLLATLINNGATTLCYDGQYFFDTDHSDPGSAYTTNQSNKGTSAAAAAIPTDLEFVAAIRTMRAGLYGFKDGDGDPMMPPKGAVFTLHIPTDYLAVAERVQKADTLTGPIANDCKGTYEIVINPYIPTPTTSHGYMYMFNTASPRKPFIYQVAEPVTLEDDMGGESDFNNKSVSFGSFGYYNIGYGDWRSAFMYDFT